MFFKPNFLKETGTKIRFSNDVKITLKGSSSNFIKSRAKEITQKYPVCNCIKNECSEIVFNLGIPEEIKKEISDLSGKAFVNNEEAYILYIGNTTTIYANKESGLVFGLATIEQMLSEEELREVIWYDYPVCPVRGYRLYTPGREYIPDFKEMIDLLVYYKYNSIVLEIGGAMEYKNHPEINKAWVEMCTDMQEYSGKAIDVQRGIGWEKNSIHIDNGNGSFLTQDEMRELVKYCADRGIKMIPEMPSLSHCDYMLFCRNDICERPSDPHPDTYCPSNPESYKLYYELLEEVIDVFKPEYVNIGHDEVYSLCICDKCKERDAVEIFVTDVKKHREFLASKGIKTLMWGENLLNAETPDGIPVGGAEWFYINQETGERIISKHALYDCAGKIPNDVTMLQWYWSFGDKYDKVYHEHGYPMLYGNLRTALLKNWQKRVEWGAKGGFVSNWGSIEDEYMQRNVQSFELVHTAYAFWCEDYDDAKREYFVKKAAEECYRYRNQRIILNSEKVDGNANFIKVLHTTDYEIVRDKYFYDGVFIVDSTYSLGDYIVTYSDGTTSKINVKYGTHVANWDIKEDATIDAYTETLYGTLPKKIGDKLYFECLFENPQKGKQITGIHFEKDAEKNSQVFLKGYELF